MSVMIDLINEWAENSEISPLLIGGSKEEIEKYAPAILGVTGHVVKSIKEEG